MNRGIKKSGIKVRYDRILICVIVLLIIGFICYLYINRDLKNIYITGNKYLNDQTIIEIASLENYPKMLKIDTLEIKEKLLKNNYINDVQIKKNYKEVVIEIKEAFPIYFDSTTNMTVLSNGKTVEDKYIVPILINYIPDTVIEEFRKAISEVNSEIMAKISEIKYDPNIDPERFLLTMTDGNYVYINVNRFNLINNYLTIISNFKDKKGIIYLDSGSHFELFKENKKS